MISVTRGLYAGFVATLMMVSSVDQPLAMFPQRAPSGSWNLVLHISGGFAGLDREVHVDGNGNVKAVDGRRKVTVTDRIPAAVITELDALVSKVSRTESTRNSQCRDCLLYRLELRTRAGFVVATDFDDISIVGTDFEPLIKRLTTLLNEALSKS